MRGGCERRAERVLRRGDGQVGAMLAGGKARDEGHGWVWVKGEERVEEGEVRRRYREGRKKGWPCLVGGWRLEEGGQEEGLIERMEREVRWPSVEWDRLNRMVNESTDPMEKVGALGLMLCSLHREEKVFREEIQRETINLLNEITGSMVEPIQLNLLTVPKVLSLEPQPSTLLETRTRLIFSQEESKDSDDLFVFAPWQPTSSAGHSHSA